MNRYVEITKDGNNYTVNPNATPSENGNAYCWLSSEDSILWYNFNVSPSTQSDYVDSFAMWVINDGSITVKTGTDKPWGEYVKVSDTEFTLTDERAGITTTYTRDTTKDFTLWN